MRQYLVLKTHTSWRRRLTEGQQLATSEFEPGEVGALMDLGVLEPIEEALDFHGIDFDEADEEAF